MTPFGLAWRGLLRQPARAVLAVLGVSAVGALLFDMLLLSRGLVLSFGELLERAGFDVRVTATQAVPTQGPPLAGASALAAEIRRLEEVAEVVPLRADRATALRPDGGSTVGVTLIGSDGGDPTTWWRIARGNDLPAGGAEGPGREAPPATSPAAALINENLAQRLELGPGDALRLRGGDSSSTLPPVELRVVGIAAFPFDTARELTVAVGLDTYDRIHGAPPSDLADLLLVRSAPGHGAPAAVEAIRAGHGELHVFSNEHLLARFRGTDFSYFRQISFVLTVMTLFFAFVLVATVLTVSVNQRYGEIAGLRALGFSRRRVVADLLCEMALLVGAGGLLALPLGALLALWLDAILRDMPWIPRDLHFFVFHPQALALHAVLIVLTGLLASAWPVWLVARLPIAETLRRETVS